MVVHYAIKAGINIGEETVTETKKGKKREREREVKKGEEQVERLVRLNINN